MNQQVLVNNCQASSSISPTVHRIKELDVTIQAWECLTADEHIHASLLGPLQGLAFGVKDVINVRGLPTRCGSEFEDDRPAASDAMCVAMLRAAGAVPIGKTRTAEFAYRRPPITINPIAPGHTPGGSSSGSAAAVAAGMVPFALSTQTGGSIMRPAAYCGVVGFKPSFGLISRSGLAPGCESLDTIGWHAIDLPIAHRVGRVLMGSDNSELLATTSLDRLSALFIDEPGEESPDVETAANLKYVRALLIEQSVATCSQLDVHTAKLNEYLRSHKVLMNYELARSLRPIVAQHGAISEPVKSLLQESESIRRVDYMDAMASQFRDRAAWSTFAQGADFIVAPSAPTTAPFGLDNSGSSAYCRAWTYLGWPCLHVPIGKSKSGLPIGFQIVMPWGSDFEVFAVASAIWRLHELRQSTQAPI